MPIELVLDRFSSRKQYVVAGFNKDSEQDYDFFAEAYMAVSGGMTMRQLQMLICEKCVVTDLDMLTQDIKEARRNHFLRMEIPKNASDDWAKKELVYVGSMPMEGQSKWQLFWNTKIEERPDRVVLTLIAQGKFKSAKTG